jgi:hypothetical protein
MLRLLVMLILASVHGCITACRATYGLVPKQGQAAKPIAIESASFVAVQISFLQKKKNGCPLSHGQRNSNTVGWSGVFFEHVCPLYRPLTSPRPLSPLPSSQRHKREVSPLPFEMKHPHTYTETSPRPSHLAQTLLPNLNHPSKPKTTKHPTLSQSANLKTSKL